MGVKEKATEQQVTTALSEPQQKNQVKAEHKTQLSTSKIKRDFNISGQIGDLSQKDRLSYLALAHRIVHGTGHD